jgi:hypothetical protein
MRARLAYISSLGTTTILVASAIFVLGVVGTIVAFKGWPGGGSNADVQSVPLATPAAANPVRRVVRAGRARPPARANRPAAAAARRTSTAGLVKQPEAGSGVVPGLVMVPVHPVPVTTPTTVPAPPAPAPGSSHLPNGSAPAGSPEVPAVPANPVAQLPPILVPEPVTDLASLPPAPPVPPVPAPGVPLPGAQVDTVVTDVLGTLPPPPGDTPLRRR